MSRPNVTNTTPRNTDQSFPGHNAHQGSVSISKDVSREAVVITTIVNEESQDYSADGYNVGGIKFRFLKTDFYKDDSELQFAFPLESNIVEYPLRNEIVVIQKILNRWYYTRKLNINNKITSQAVFGLNEELSPIVGSKQSAVLNDRVRSTGPKKVETPKSSNLLGDYFKVNEGVKRLRHQEGDLIFEGRSGHSIRFGINKENLSPNLLIRVGQGFDVKPNIDSQYSLVVEDINKDKSSIYIVSDELVKLQYSTLNSPVHFKSITDAPSSLLGNQIIINSDRIVLNSKKEKIMGFAAAGIHWTSKTDISSDIERDNIFLIGRDKKSTINRDELTKITRDKELTAGGKWEAKISKFIRFTATDKHSFISPKVFLGIDKEDEPIVLGNALVKFLTKLIEAQIKASPKYVMTSMGPGILSPDVLKTLLQLRIDLQKGKLASFNSEVSFTTKKFKR